MLHRPLSAGLTLPITTPPLAGGIEDAPTDEAAIAAPPGAGLRVDVAVAEGEAVAAGAVLARLRADPAVALVAPMPGRVAAVRLRPGRQLDEIVLFHEAGGDRLRHDTTAAGADDAALRALMQVAGVWPLLRRRPFGGMPAAGEVPAAIFVMASDTRPLAPDPTRALEGRQEDFALGLDALARLTPGPVLLGQSAGVALTDAGAARGRLRVLPSGPRHPQGLPGIQIHRHFPALPERPVWDIHAEDVAGLGELLATGQMPAARLVMVAGPGLSETRLLRCQPGADLRGLAHGVVRPGPHRLLTGSVLDGREARWLGWRDRQVTVLPREDAPPRPHWFRAALTRAARPRPLIPTAALDQALGGALPAAVLARALGAGDDETAARLGALSLLEEDLALADYVTAAAPRLALRLRGMLDRIAAEEGAP